MTRGTLASEPLEENCVAPMEAGCHVGMSRDSPGIVKIRLRGGGEDLATSTVRAQLEKLIRVTLVDGRVLIGKFTCFDKQRNVLLTEAKEQKFATSTSDTASLKPEHERHLGLVLVGRQHIAGCRALAAEM